MKKFFLWWRFIPWWARFFIGDSVFFLLWFFLAKSCWNFYDMNSYFHVESGVFGSLLGYAMFFYINSASEFFLRFVKSRKAAPTDPEV